MTLIMNYEKKQHELPPEGTHNAKLVRIKEWGKVPTRYGEKEQLSLVWELLDARDSQGKPFEVYQRFNADPEGFGPKAFLRVAVKEIIGKDPGNKFDLGTLLDRNVQLVLKYKQADDGFTYCNVVVVLNSHIRCFQKAS